MFNQTFPKIIAVLALPMFLGAISAEARVARGSMAIQEETTADDANKSTQADTKKLRQGNRVQVELPITNKSAVKVQQTIERLLEKAPKLENPDDRPPIVVLEFDTSSGKTGKGSDLGACLDLARYLISLDLNRIETIAHIPAPRGYQETDGVEAVELKSALNGHAVLVAIAANRLSMNQDSVIGLAGIDEENVGELERSIYQTIASSRLTLRVPVVMSMLEGREAVYRISTPDGVFFVNQSERAQHVH